QGIAARLIDKRLAGASGRVLMITGQRFADHYRRWGFVRIAPEAAPPCIRLNYWLGHVCGGLISGFQRPGPQPLLVPRETPDTHSAPTAPTPPPNVDRPPPPQSHIAPSGEIAPNDPKREPHTRVP